MPSIEELHIVLLPHTQHHGVLGVTQLQDSHLHVGNGVTRLVKMVSCCLVQFLVSNISDMLLHPPYIGSGTATHIIEATIGFGALNIEHIETLHIAVDFSIDMNNFSSCRSLHSFGSLNKVTD